MGRALNFDTSIPHHTNNMGVASRIYSSTHYCMANSEHKNVRSLKEVVIDEETPTVDAHTVVIMCVKISLILFQQCVLMITSKLELQTPLLMIFISLDWFDSNRVTHPAPCIFVTHNSSSKRPRDHQYRSQ